jgi:hypothetical protein
MILRHTALAVLIAGCRLGYEDDPVCAGPLGEDPDGDGIVSLWEGPADLDEDGFPNYLDDDSDGDAISDADEAGAPSCRDAPRDIDADGVYDAYDLDGNGDSVPDGVQRATDADGDMVPDPLDLDTDGDGVANRDELADGDADIDRDGLVDPVDPDSDGDTISDLDESPLDDDADGVPNRRDRDSDGDGILDRIEAGDDDLATAPIECADEIDLVSERFGADGRADFRDRDADGDGLIDDEELRLGTSICGVDTDLDLWPDLYEVAFEQTTCRAGDEPECGCVLNPDCTPPREDVFAVLPYGGPTVERDALFDATIRSADVLFLWNTDRDQIYWGIGLPTTDVVAQAFQRPSGNLAEGFRRIAPDAWIGSASANSVVSSDGGFVGDPAASLNVTLPMTDGTDLATIASRFSLISGPGDMGTEAIVQLFRGPGSCGPGRFGPACLREDAIPFVFHLLYSGCPANGPPFDQCEDYEPDLFYPPLHEWSEMVSTLRESDAVYVGLRSEPPVSGDGGAAPVTPDVPIFPCREWFVFEGRDVPDAGCSYVTETARASGAVDHAGDAIAYELYMTPADARRLPDGTHPPYGPELLLTAFDRALHAKRLDVDSVRRDDPSDPTGVDATAFVKNVVPACNAARPVETCWIAPDPVPQESAVYATDRTTFYSAIGGTRVRFRLELGNDVVQPTTRVQVFVAFVDARGDSRTVLDTRRVFVIVPPAELE